MEHLEQSETFLAKWLANDIPEEALKAFEQTEDYELFSKIAMESKGFTREHLDKEAVYTSILDALNDHKKEATKVRPLFPKWLAAAAASVVLFITAFYLFNGNTTESSGFGEQLAVVLPDNSEVTLNAKSQLTYNKKDWDNNRRLTLEGEAYFKVAKGSTFTVATSEGNVSVLGTQFNVLQDKDFLEVTCFEGQIKVESHGNVVFLTAGKIFKSHKGKVIPENEGTDSSRPDWTSGESVFKSIPLQVVLNSLKKQYDVKIKSNIHDANKLFTGSFAHSNLEQALEAVLLPMNITYSFSENGDNTILLEQKE